MIWYDDTRWRDSGRQVKVGPLDGRLMLFVILLLLFPSFILLYMTLGAMAFFYALDYMGYTLPNAFRKIKTLISGKNRKGTPYWKQHKYKY